MFPSVTKPHLIKDVFQERYVRQGDKSIVYKDVFQKYTSID